MFFTYPRYPAILLVVTRSNDEEEGRWYISLCETETYLQMTPLFCLFNGLDCCTYVTAFSVFLFFFQGIWQVKMVFFVGNLAHFYSVFRLLELLLSLKPKLIWSCYQGTEGVVKSIAGLPN